MITDIKHIIREIFLLAIIYGISLFIENVIPIPASIISLVFLFLLLSLKLLKLHHFAVLTPFVLVHLSFFFIPASVKVVEAKELLAGNAVKILILLFVSGVLVMGVTGAVVQYFIKNENKDADINE